MNENNSKLKTNSEKPKAQTKSDKPAVKDSGKFAVIKTGGKQYIVEAGRYYDFEKLSGEEGSTVNFDEVLLVVEGDNIQIGTPLVDGAKVTGKILSQFKNDTIRVFKYKKRKRTRKTYGHRQPQTKVEITSIK